MNQGIVIGGGIAGLVSAIRLALDGHAVTLLEKQDQLGGQIKRIEEGKHVFEIGATPISMPWVIEQVFHDAGQRLTETLDFVPLSVNSRHFFHNSQVIDLTANPDHMAYQLKYFSLEDRLGFIDYLNRLQSIYKGVEAYWLNNPLFSWQDLLSLKGMKAWLSFHPFQSMDRLHRYFFDDPRLIGMMNRYADYMNASPFKMPALGAMIGYLELTQGTYQVRGGVWQLIVALEKLAQQVGVTIHKACQVDEILVKDERVVGVRSSEQKWEADFVVSNVDTLTAQATLLKRKHLLTDEEKLSSSKFICLLGIKKEYDHLIHHNVFYPEQIGREFVDIFERGEWPLTPAIDVQTLNGNSLCITVPVPARGFQDQRIPDYKQYKAQLVYQLETEWQLEGLSNQIETEMMFGPKELESWTGSYRGALSGMAYHGIKAFFSPSLRDQKLEGLYYTGGTTRPGSTTTLSVISGIHVSDMIGFDLSQKVVQA
ncbi:phytoene desaturase [Hazenella sp. IB182357]|uniref:4,4'-diaponeurosporene oxygenase n=1 Tax=Polycladospora coralii TaxID=2771432 RepID=A0A926NBT0_9BACL|nr:phytoene desaturase family protein [Polycladospora coralii]MBD1372895.1 phytoene desaturase [Polycladospora coralii]